MSMFFKWLCTDRASSPRRALLHLTAIALCVAAPAAHAGGKVKVKGQISASAQLNPDYQGRPSPIVLILFQLKSAETFKNADFFSLYDPDSHVLGGDLIGRSQMMLQPGEMRPFEAEFDEAARYIGVVAAFRDIEKAEWRGLVELPQKGFFKHLFSHSKFVIKLDPLALSARIE